MDNETIDKLYDNMIETADNISNNKTMSTEDMETLKKIDNELKSFSDSQQVVSAPFDNIKGEKAMIKYNPNTGEIAVADTKESINSLSEKHWDAFNNINSELTLDGINEDILKNILNDKEVRDLNEVTTMISLISRKLKGEKILNSYFELPKSYRDDVDSIANSVQNSNIDNTFKSKKYIADMFLDQIVNEYKNANNASMDLDTMLAGFDKELEKFIDKSYNELGSMMISFDDERKAEINAAIKRCEDEGKTESIEKLQSIKDNIDKAYSLTEFIEACKKIKIKNSEIADPKKVFNSFNFKYENHKNVINDISQCSAILDRHLPEYSYKNKLMLCIAFCKYCLNFSPDNMAEHTFMYYFIRNIIMIDRLNPKGNIYESMDERSKVFYDEFTSNLSKCMNNLIERNRTLK